MYFVLVSAVWMSIYMKRTCIMWDWQSFGMTPLYMNFLTFFATYYTYLLLLVFKTGSHTMFWSLNKDQGSDRYKSREKHFFDFLYTFSVPSNILSLQSLLLFFIVLRCQLLKIKQISKKYFKLIYFYYLPKSKALLFRNVQLTWILGQCHWFPISHGMHLLASPDIVKVGDFQVNKWLW